MHKLTDIDPDTRRATCAVCGPTRVRQRGVQRGRVTWRCITVAERGSRERYWRKRGIDLSIEEYEQMFMEQGGRCAICGDAHETFHVDHDHKTGKVRGLLCLVCNVGVGAFRDSPESLRAAAAYLERSGT